MSSSHTIRVYHIQCTIIDFSKFTIKFMFNRFLLFCSLVLKGGFFKLGSVAYFGSQALWDLKPHDTTNCINMKQVVQKY